MNDQPLDITDFLKLILESIEVAGVEYLIGGAIAEWADRKGIYPFPRRPDSLQAHVFGIEWTAETCP